ncbi:hypothetical protein J437_LFUL013804, partial [Ladona fulva]
MNVIEFFSGIGGMHYSLKGAGIKCKVVAAVDINTSANEVYRHNFPETPVFQRNIQSFSSDEINKFNPDIITMSPPCQPFTRQVGLYFCAVQVGLKKDSKDTRSDALMHIIQLLPDLTQNLKYIILENVKGFEVSFARDLFIETLKACNFEFQEFLLNPMDYYIPNSRLRYYLIAARGYSDGQFVRRDIMNEIPFTPEEILAIHREKNPFVECDGDSVHIKVDSLSKILEVGRNTTPYLIPKAMISKYGRLFDITFPFSKRSCCFTKAYGRYAEGTGSVLCPTSSVELAEAQLHKIRTILQCSEDKKQTSEELSVFMTNLGLRYFSPREIASLMCFPESFSWPDHYSCQQMYRLLGNSINVYVVTLLLIYLSNELNH